MEGSLGKGSLLWRAVAEDGERSLGRVAQVDGEGLRVSGEVEVEGAGAAGVFTGAAGDDQGERGYHRHDAGSRPGRWG